MKWDEKFGEVKYVGGEGRWDLTWQHEGRISVLLMRITVQTGEKQLSWAPSSSNRFSSWLLFRRITRQCYCNYNCSFNETVEAILVCCYFIYTGWCLNIGSASHGLRFTCPGDLVEVMLTLLHGTSKSLCAKTPK